MSTQQPYTLESHIKKLKYTYVKMYCRGYLKLNCSEQQRTGS